MVNTCNLPKQQVNQGKARIPTRTLLGMKQCHDLPAMPRSSRLVTRNTKSGENRVWRVWPAIYDPSETSAKCRGFFSLAVNNLICANMAQFRRGGEGTVGK